MSDAVERYINFADSCVQASERRSTAGEAAPDLGAGQISALCAIAHAIDRLADAVLEHGGKL